MALLIKYILVKYCLLGGSWCSGQVNRTFYTLRLKSNNKLANLPTSNFFEKLLQCTQEGCLPLLDMSRAFLPPQQYPSNHYPTVPTYLLSHA